MDPLSVLREYTIRGALQLVEIQGDECRFGDEYRFPKAVETAYRSRAGQLYSLESLVFFVKNAGARHTDYMALARTARVQIVTFTDRMPLLGYLEGRVANSDAIDLVAPLPIAAPAAVVPPASLPPAVTPGRFREEEEAEEGGPSVKRIRGLPGVERVQVGGATTLGEAHKLSDIELIMARERPVRDREEILLCLKKKDAFANVLQMLNARQEDKQKMEAERQRREQQRRADEKEKHRGSYNNAQGAHRSSEDKGYWKEYMGNNAAEELGINTYMTNVQDTAMPKESVQPVVENLALLPRSIPRPPHGSQRAKPEGPPIIFVPNAAQTLVNTYNIKEFLEDGVFVLPEVKAKTLVKKPEFVALERKMGREKPVTYHVRDRPESLSRRDWDRVVAVFVLGKEWQFKDWPFKDHVESLNKVMGVYVRFDDASMESTAAVKQWNVKFLSVSKHKRHQDRTAAMEFWDKLDVFLRARRSTLQF